jgi:O-antigen ligase
VWLALPAAATAGLAFVAGGFFPAATALAAIALGLALVLRMTTADRPWEGFGAALGVASGALALLAVWTLLSGSWSDAPSRAAIEFDRTLLYLLVLLLFGFVARRAGDLATLLRWLAAAVCAVCVVAFLARLLPATFNSEELFANDRLTYPLTYWNAMGIFSALGLVLALHVTSAPGEPVAARLLAAAACPPVAAVLYFTFSRGGIAAAAIGVVLYLLIAHPRGLLGGLLAVVPTTAVALWVAYDADLLATSRFASAAAEGQREHVLVIGAVCMVAAAGLRALALPLDARAERWRIPEHRRTTVRWVAGAVAVVALVVVVVAADLPGRIDQERREFAQGAILPGTPDLRDRLVRSGNNGRVANWRVAREGFEAQTLHGSGAGTYRLLWERDRPAPPFNVTDGHSLYLEVAAELGVVGVVLLLIALLTPLGVAAARLRGEERHAHGAFLAAGLMLLIHAGVDWDWEMPAIFLWYFAASGVVLAAPAGGGGHAPARLTRVLAGLACLALILTPATVYFSQTALAGAIEAFDRGDCRTAIDKALDARDDFGDRPEPYEILGYCDARAGQNALAVRAMRSAVERDPDNWQYAYGLAVTQALAGQDPRAEAARARRLNPLEPLARGLTRDLRRAGPQRWRRVAARAQVPRG